LKTRQSGGSIPVDSEYSAISSHAGRTAEEVQKFYRFRRPFREFAEDIEMPLWSRLVHPV
jgi:hypothetical protein